MKQPLRIVYLLVAFFSGLVAIAKEGGEEPIKTPNPVVGQRNRNEKN